jgi:NADH-quinone oxidoreductase subunit L
VYLVARLGFLFILSADALHVIAWTGAVTAFFAGTMAIAQKDIKKVLAYSTVSQLGYMFLGCGVGAFSAGVFHVITHAFFKALLFLGAGSVIFGMHHEQDIMKMGGLRSKMPRTFLTFGIGYLAICGIPPFSGFFSKDEILWRAMSSEFGSPLLWALAAATAVMTAVYMTRLFSYTFLGKARGHHEAHESPAVMTVPLMVLGVLSALGGFIGIPHASWLEHWLEPIVPSAKEMEGLGHSLEWGLMALSVVLAGTAVFFGLRFFSNMDRAEKVKRRFSGLHKILENKWYVDEFFEAVIVNPIGGMCRALWRGFDVAVIDGVVNGVGRAATWTGQTLRVLQSGSIQTYGVYLLLGMVAFLVFIWGF